MNMTWQPDAGTSRPELFADRVLVCDGAMGTMLHSTGAPLDRALCELNLSQPRLVGDLHTAYTTAGVDLLQTNTFDANRLRLGRFGLQDSVAEINIAGARLARQAAQEAERQVLVAGSVGPVTSANSATRVPAETRAAALSEQIEALADWVDLIILETFGDIDSLAQAAEIALAGCDLPVIAQLTFDDDARTLRGKHPSEAAALLSEFNLAAIGANCTVGPAVMQDVVAGLVAGTDLPVSVQPNAGVPRRLGRQLRYAHNVEYFADAATRFVAAGASIVGGCCGTTPAHIRALARAISGTPAPRPVPRTRRGADRAGSAYRSVAPEALHTPVSWPKAGEFVVVAGLRAPRSSDVTTFVERAGELKSAGVDYLAIIDPAQPMARVSPVAAGVVLSERVGTEVMLRMEAADRSLAALQADLLGAYALGLQTVVCRTGLPRAIGDYPDPGSLWDVDAVRLIGALSGLNEGVDWRGVPTPERTRFVIGAQVNTSAGDRRRELDRAEEKVRAGAHFLMTDVIYDVAEAQQVLAALRTRGVDTPILAAVAPFQDARTVERLTQEDPEVSIPPSVLAAYRRIAEHPREAVTNTLHTAEKLRELISGVIVYAPDDADTRMIDVVRGLRALGGGVRDE
jgi:homocysteine S-methyltransferase